MAELDDDSLANVLRGLNVVTLKYVLAPGDLDQKYRTRPVSIAKFFLRGFYCCVAPIPNPRKLAMCTANDRYKRA